MQTKNNLVVMLTHNDQTVLEAAKIFEQCRHSKAKFWGFKEVPLPLENMKHLYAYMKECGKTTFLEVVEYTEDAGLVGAEIAFECGCDILMGTRFFDSINQFCKEHQIKYMPFVGGLSLYKTFFLFCIWSLFFTRHISVIQIIINRRFLCPLR